jgi:NYN domain
MRTAIAYVDGHNFYHGAVKKRPELKWLDFVGLCRKLLPDHHLFTVRYYTARVIDRPNDPHQSQRQDVYLRALAARGGIEIVEGKFVVRRKRVRTTINKWVTADVAEEKGSDVNLGADLVWDACHHTMDCALVLSNDFDLQRPVHRAIEAGADVLVVNPHRAARQRPAVKGTGTVNLRLHHLRNHQLPDPVIDAAGRPIHRPHTWS